MATVAPYGSWRSPIAPADVARGGRRLGAATGVAPAFAIESFTDIEADVRQSVLRVRRSDFLPHTDAVRGFVYDVDTHALREVKVEVDDGDGGPETERD